MLPFGRMVKYGNIVPDPRSGFRIISTGDALLLITKSGDLWVRGYNRYGKLGIGNNTTTYVRDWTKVRSDVKFACGSGLLTVIFTKDNRILYCGDKWFETGGVGSAQIFKWTDVTYQFGAVDLSTVRDMKMSYYTIGLLTTNNQLYAKGFDNNLSFGGVSNKATAVFIANNVQELYTSLVSTIYVDTSGILHRCGMSSNGSLGNNVNLTSYLSYSQTGMTIKDIGMMTTNTGLLYTDSSARTRYFIAGQNLNKQMGNAAAANAITSTYTELSGSVDKFSSLWENDGDLMTFAVGKNTNQLFYAGTNTFHASGGVSSFADTYELVPMVFNDIQEVLCAQRLSVVHDSTKWYYCGDANSMYGLPDVSTFTELPLPF
ncbi:X-linked retinitis pigmentosa GTPase regulator [Escherichia phage ph0011]|nr:X-linked retinitis pigmentosa GTPase regulator [Escherichia phage ph0011]